MEVEIETVLFATQYCPEALEESALYCQFYQLKGGEDVKRSKTYEVENQGNADLILKVIKRCELRPITDQCFTDFLKEKRGSING